MWMPTNGIWKCPFCNAKCTFRNRFLFFSPSKEANIMGLNEMPEKLWHKIGFMQWIGFFNWTHCPRAGVCLKWQIYRGIAKNLEKATFFVVLFIFFDNFLPIALEKDVL